MEGEEYETVEYRIDVNNDKEGETVGRDTEKGEGKESIHVMKEGGFP